MSTSESILGNFEVVFGVGEVQRRMRTDEDDGEVNAGGESALSPRRFGVPRRRSPRDPAPALRVGRRAAVGLAPGMS